VIYFKDFMESADESAHRIAQAEAERAHRRKEARKRQKSAETFTQTQKEKQLDTKHSSEDKRDAYNQRMERVKSTTNKRHHQSSLHLAAKGAVKSAIKGTLKGAVKLAKKAIQRDSD